MNTFVLAQGATVLAVLIPMASSAPALAQELDYPVDTVAMIAAYAAGGADDTVGRLVADEHSHRLSVNFVVKNVGGATGAIGAEQVARADGDGSTLLPVGNAIFTTAPQLAEEAVRMLVSLIWR